jgi:hypothetical protein
LATKVTLYIWSTYLLQESLHGTKTALNDLLVCNSKAVKINQPLA